MDFHFCVSFFFFKQKTAYEMRISDWSSDVCSSDLPSRASVRTREQRADQQYHDADANRSIGKIEDQKWAPFADMQVQEIDHEAKADAIEDKIGRASCRERVCQYV